MIKIFFNILIFFMFLSCNVNQENKNLRGKNIQNQKKLVLGVEQIDSILHIIKDKKLALMVNQTSMVGNIHLIDTLLSRGANIKKIIVPEHGFRGNSPDGKEIKDDIDAKTKLPIISLYGKKIKKPTKEMLDNIDIIIYDIQDVGLRFYTFISSLHYLMEASAENNKSIIVLDRPNPNANYVDGPIREKEHKSFVGMHPVPILYGMTVGEYAKMINQEGWLKNHVNAKLTIVKMLNYKHSLNYVLPIPPSPNLPNQKAIMLYPSLCLFEGTVISIGRGTEFPFQVIGYPNNPKGEFLFTPKKIPNKSLRPKFENIECKGLDLRNIDFKGGLSLKWIIDIYSNYKDKDKFFKGYFDKLAGTKVLRQQIESGMNEKQIKESWNKDLLKFKKIRNKYLIYD